MLEALTDHDLARAFGGAEKAPELPKPESPKPEPPNPAALCPNGLDHQTTVRVGGQVVWQKTVCK